jgi:hypothetical protein
MTRIRRIVFDVLKPHDPDPVALARRVAEVASVAGANVSLVETDREVQNVKLTVEGDDVDPSAVEAAVRDLGGTVHSVDEAVCGDHTVEYRPTPQD